MRLQHLGICHPTSSIAVCVILSLFGLADVAGQGRRNGPKATTSDPAAGTTSTQSSGLAVDVTSKDKVASATIAANLHRSDLGSVDGFLTGSGPIDGGPDVAVVLGDLKGLRNATKLRIGLTGMSWRWNVDTAGTRSVCRSAWVERANRPKAVSDSIDKALKDEPEGRRVHVRDSVIAALAAKKCKRQAVPSRYQAEFDEHVVYGRIWQYGGTLEFGRQDLGYADSTAVAFRKKVTNPLAVTVGGGVYLRGRIDDGGGMDGHGVTPAPCRRGRTS